MRTTVTLDPDVRLLLAEAMKERGISFKQAINDSIRTGMAPARQRKRRFVQRTYSMGAAHHFRWDKALQAAGDMEGVELARKLGLGR